MTPLQLAGAARDPFGAQRPAPDATASNWDYATANSGFTGHQHDVNLGLVNMRGRLFDARLGRFTKADPFITEPFNPQGLNRYSYVQNNPLNFVDPSGFQDEPPPNVGSYYGPGYSNNYSGAGYYTNQAAPAGMPLVATQTDSHAGTVGSSGYYPPANFSQGSTAAQQQSVAEHNSQLVQKGDTPSQTMAGASAAQTRNTNVQQTSNAASAAATPNKNMTQAAAPPPQGGYSVPNPWWEDQIMQHPYRTWGVATVGASALVLGGWALLAPAAEGGAAATGVAAAEGGTLVEQLAAQGVKFAPENIAAIEKIGGRIIFLETGTARAGLAHIIERHAADFAARGIGASQIPNAIMTALRVGAVVGMQGGRPIYEFIYNGGLQRIAITVANNGFIVGANPAGFP